MQLTEPRHQAAIPCAESRALAPRRPRPWWLLALLAAVMLAGCTGEIGFGSDDASSTGDTRQGDVFDAPDGLLDTSDRDLTPVEPDFGEITVTPEMCASMETRAGVAPMRLLTRYEYDATIRDLLGASPVASVSFPPENLAAGFENNAYVHVVSPLAVRTYMEAAESVAAEAVATRLDTLLPCDPAVVGEFACVDAFVRQLGPRAFRRPLTPAELATFQELAATGLELFDLESAVALVIEAMLQSPQFLYRMELQDTIGDGELVLVDDYEMATRLSYFFWASMPDEALFEAASRGELSTPDQIEAAARRLLDDPRASATLRAFYRQWLHLRELDAAVRDAATYPDWQIEMNAAWQESVLRFVGHVYGPQGQGTFEELMTSPLVFLDPGLAPVYGVTEPLSTMTPFEFAADERAGLLTQPGLLAALSNPDQSSPIRRGVFVRESLLCQPLDPPPADLPIMPPDPDPNATTRERFAEHTESKACSGCHVKIDPIGFGLERYDAMGVYRAVENGFAVDSSGYLGDVPASMEGEFDGGVELSTRLATGEVVASCLAETWFRFAIGRQYGDDDACSVYRVQQAFTDSGGDLREMLVQIALSDTFRYRRAQSVPEPDAP